MTEHERALYVWVVEQLAQAAQTKGESFDAAPMRWQPLPGDAGQRRYYRLICNNARFIAVYSPPATEPNASFVGIGEFLLQHGLWVPRFLAKNMQQGFFLLDDLGSDLYLQHLNEERVENLYAQGLSALLKIQSCPKNEALFPRYDRAKLLEELSLFPDWLIEKKLAHNLTSVERNLLDRTFTLLIDSACEQPQVVVHRDYHSRNIIHGVNGEPGILDFQDGVIGPVTYDLVSLLRDCYIRWPNERVQGWALTYRNMVLAAGVIPPVDEPTFLRWFDLMGLQRHIKVLGIFARLSLRDGKHGYLQDLPLVISYVRDVAKANPDMHEFLHWFDETLMPLIRLQPWMKSV